MDLTEWSAEITPGAGLPVPREMPVVGTLPARTDFHTARGYRYIGMFYTCVPDALYPWDPKLVKLIQEFAPDTVPMWVHWVFRTPRDIENEQDVVFGRHALGRVIKPARTDLVPFHCEMPTMPCQGLTFERPNAIWFIHQGDSPRDEYLDLPGAYLPFDGGLVKKAWDSWAGADNKTEKEWKEELKEEMINRPYREYVKQKEARAAEMAERNRDFAQYARRVIEKVSDSEIEAYQRLQAAK
ncbi:MAG: hypothetical protein GTO63_15735 [Anaerolineae bacterium]|nr:hypothetical protein [Anaerolineae bacterium]NIN96280.1 hypothetical protein [Anaerolineae bacterium]NIQ79300.1 hypothetical protein [Anaerolineae bacterium]